MMSCIGEDKAPAITFTTHRTKRLSELTAADIPRGLTPEDVALDACSDCAYEDDACVIHRHNDSGEV